MKKKINSVDDFMAIAAEVEKTVDAMIESVQEIKDDRGRPIYLDVLPYDLSSELIEYIHSIKIRLERLAKTGSFIEVKNEQNNEE